MSCVLSLGISCHFGPIRKLDENRDKYIAEALQAASGVLVVILIYYFHGKSNVGFTVAHRKPGTFLSVPLSADLANNRWLNQRSDPDSESLPSVLTKVLKTETKIIVRDMFSGFHHFSCLGVSFQGVSCSS